MGLVMAAPPLLLLLQAAAAVGGSPSGRRPHICFILADVRKSNRCCRARRPHCWHCWTACS